MFVRCVIVEIRREIGDVKLVLLTCGLRLFLAELKFKGQISGFGNEISYFISS